MKTLEDIKHFYSRTLLADLAVLEEKRKKIVRKLICLGIVLLSVLVISLFIFRQSLTGDFRVLIFPVVICAVICGALCKFLSKGYVTEFKTLVIQKIVKFIDEDLEYSKSGYIRESLFMLCQIFQKSPDRYRGDDFVSGKVGATKIKFSEIHAEYQSGSGKNRHWHTIFKGLFFVGDFNKDFTCRTVVLPDTAEKFFGRIGQKLQSLNKFRGQLIKLEDPEFESFFVVYGSDQIEARYLLSTSLMKRIVDFKKKTGRKIYLSFVGSMIFVAISYTKDLFEPRLFKTLLDFEPIREYFEDLQLAVAVVEDLNLNTRIWTKR